MIEHNRLLEVQKRADEVSIRTLLLKFVEYVKLLLRNWYWVFLGAFLFGLGFVYRAKNVIETYPASIEIFINPANIDKDNEELMQVFTKLLTTQRILLSALLKPLGNKKTEGMLINAYLKTYQDRNPAGLPSEIPNAFSFENNDLTQMTKVERQVLNGIIEKIYTPLDDYSDGFISFSTDNKLGFIVINVSTPSEELSLLMLDAIHNETEKYFLQNILNNNNSAYVNLEVETDSLARKYKENYYQLNRYKDKRGRLLSRNANNTKPDNTVISEIKYLEKKIHRLSVEAEINKTSYLAALEQQKIAQLDNDQEAMIIKELKRTIAPIDPYQPNVKLFGLKGGFYGAFSVIFIIIISSLFVEIKKEIYQ